MPRLVFAIVLFAFRPTGRPSAYTIHRSGDYSGSTAKNGRAKKKPMKSFPRTHPRSQLPDPRSSINRFPAHSPQRPRGACGENTDGDTKPKPSTDQKWPTVKQNPKLRFPAHLRSGLSDHRPPTTGPVSPHNSRTASAALVASLVFSHNGRNPADIRPPDRTIIGRARH